ncbi:U3 snoRNA associated-domain-containing protein [Phyllosticta capitalensis]|uniref:U3 snoRNA associated-domain-containing protein n=1 Tax=Phyllosticta capitalensis TaxID=121624 RepID=UPI00312DF66B
MFSRVVDNARALLTSSPSKSSETPTTASNDQAAAMVSTRSGADTQSPLTNSVTRSAKKRFQDDTPNGTPTRNNKKPRKSSEDEDELGTPKIPLLARENPQSTPTTQTTKTSEPSSETPKKGRGRPRKSDISQPEQMLTPVPADKKQASVETPREEAKSAQQDGSQEDGSVYGTPAEDDDASIYATPATTMRPNLRGSARPTPASVTPKPRGRAARTTPSKPSRLISSQTIDEGEEESTPKAEPQVVEKPKIIRFGSEDPPVIPEPVPEPPKKAEIPTSSADEDEDSDDEAPEAVTTSSAREQARAAEEDAAKAVKEQEAAAKRKRQEREARLREQAAASKRRKQKEAESALASEDVSPPADVASSTTITASNPAELSKQSKYDLQNIPALLPDDLLAAAPAVRPPTPEPVERATVLDRKEVEKKKLNKHLKFLDEKPAKDIKKGPVRLHVLEKGNKKLPPKVNNQSKNMREQWLAGRRAQSSKGKKNFGGPERKKTGGGFLRK